MRRVSVAVLCAAVTMLACAVFAAGASATTGALGWGNNQPGQLCNGSKQGGFTPSSVGEQTSGELNGALQIVTSGDHTLILLANHKVVACGAGESGQLGNGGRVSRSLPVPVAKLTEVEAVAAGRDFSMALLKNHKIFTWGRNNRGQLGIGFATGPNKCGPEEKGESEQHEQERACALEPVEVSGLEAVAIAAGGQNALALIEGGTAKAWGDNQYGKLGNGSSVGPEKCGGPFFPEECSRKPVSVSGLEGASAVAAGGTFGMALLGSGKVVTWGENNAGQLGTTTEEKCKQPFEIFEERKPCSTKPVEVGGELGEVEAISAGGEFALALQKTHKVKAWGENSKGQLGNNSTTSSTTPVAVLQSVVPTEELSGVQRISAGTKHSIAVVEGEEARVWGDPTDFALGAGILNNKIASKAATTSIAQASAGEQATLVIGAPGPKITGLNPENGPSKGENAVKVSGANLTPLLKVRVDGKEQPEANINSISSTEFEIKSMPEDAPGGTQIEVETERAVSAQTGASKYRYEPIGNIKVGRCFKETGKGKYKNNVCTEPQENGGFEWLDAGTFFGWNGSFTGTIAAETELLLESSAGSMTCKGETSSGTWVVKGATAVTFTLTGCKTISGECSTEGATPGEIVTNPLEGLLGFINKETNKVGLDLKPETAENLFEANCGATKLVLSGAVIGQVTPVNKMTTSMNLKLKQHSGKQAVEEFDEPGSSKQTLTLKVGETSAGAGLGVETGLTNAQSLEINTNI